MKDPAKAFKENPHKKLAIDLVHEGVGPIYGHVGKPGDGNDFARAHYEQHMRVTGTIQVNDEPVLELGVTASATTPGTPLLAVDPSYRWITATTATTSAWSSTSPRARGRGLPEGAERDRPHRVLRIETEYEGETNYHKALKAKLKLANGEEHTIEGKVTGFIRCVTGARACSRTSAKA
jgi:hypothetical protein